jgi:hypothetical protein
MQGSPGKEPLQGLDGYEQMVNTFAENAKAYWRLWGPLGEPMVRVIDAWAEQQRSYLQWLRQIMERGIGIKLLSIREQRVYSLTTW